MSAVLVGATASLVLIAAMIGRRLGMLKRQHRALAEELRKRTVAASAEGMKEFAEQVARDVLERVERKAPISFAAIEAIEAIKSAFHQLFSNRKATPPGARSLILVRFLFSAKTVERVFAQQVADWRQEYDEALESGDNRRVLFVRVSGAYHFAATVVVQSVVSLSQRAAELLKTVGS
jgi:hypothetical protein